MNRRLKYCFMLMGFNLANEANDYVDFQHKANKLLDDLEKKEGTE